MSLPLLKDTKLCPMVTGTPAESANKPQMNTEDTDQNHRQINRGFTRMTRI